MFKDAFSSRSFDSQFKYPRDLYIIMLLCILIVLVKNLVVMPAGDWVLKKLDAENKIRPAKRKNFRVSFWKTVFYCSTCLYGYFILKNADWAYSLKGLSGTWGISETPSKILFYYHLEFAYYLVEIMYLFEEHNYSDFRQMFTHHVVTLLLLLTSYHRDVLRAGVVTIAIHEISDPPMELCKLARYVSYTAVTNVLFFCFMTIFIVARIGIFTFWIVLPWTFFVPQQNFDIVLYSTLPMIYGLVVMHVMWSYTLVKMAIGAATGTKLRDPREDMVEDKPKNVQPTKC